MAEKLQKNVNGVMMDMSQSEIDDMAASQKEADAYWAKNKYKHDRQPLYPQILDQLDLLYHDMTAGKGDKTGEWYKAIKKVKDDNPKPE